MAVEILRATADHLDLVAPLFDAYRRFYGCTEDLPKARGFLAERISRGDSVVFLAFVDGKPVGFTQLYPTFTSIGIKRAWILTTCNAAPEAPESRRWPATDGSGTEDGNRIRQLMDRTGDGQGQ